MLLLIITEILLITKLTINQDQLLAMIIALSQLVIALAALNFESKEPPIQEKFPKGQVLIGLLVFLSIVPLMLHHQNNFEQSTWAEAGLLIQGPFSVVLILFGVFGAVVAALTSLYLQGKK